jgi:hypothetical protein
MPILLLRCERDILFFEYDLNIVATAAMVAARKRRFGLKT